MMDPQEFFNTLQQIEITRDFIRNTRDIKDIAEQVKYLQTTMSKFGTLTDLMKTLDVIKKYIYVGKEFYSLDEAADYLSVSKGYVYHMSSNNEIRTYKPKGRLIYIARDDLNEWIRTHKFESMSKIKGVGLIRATELNEKNKLG